MTRMRKSPSFDPFQRKLGAGEEVRVGAYARRQLRRRVIIGVLGAVLIVGAFLLYRQFRVKADERTGDTYPARVKCIACDHTVTLQVEYPQPFPIQCPACREMAAQLLWQCRDCDTLFVPEQIGTDLRCPNCNGQRVGSSAVP